MSAKRFFFVLVAIFVLIGAGSTAGIVWGERFLKQKSMSVSQLIADRDLQVDSVDKLKQSSKSGEETSRIVDLISAALPKQKQQQAIVADIITISNTTTGMSSSSISSISFSGSPAPDNLSGATVVKEIQGVYSYPFTLQIKETSYTSLLALLNRFETNKRIFQVDQVQIVPDKSKTGYLSSVSISLKSFIQP